MGEPPKDESDADLRSRLGKLSDALDERHRSSGSPHERHGGPDMAGSAQAMSLGIRVLSEFVSAILVGAFIGWLVDHWLGSSPWGLVGFLMLGLAAGLWNVYRIATTSNVDGEPK